MKSLKRFMAEAETRMATLTRMSKDPKLASFASAQMKADRMATLTRMLKDPKLARFAAAQIKADRLNT